MSRSTPARLSTIVSAPIIVITSDIRINGEHLQDIAFQELSGINSSIGIESYVSVEPGGFSSHSKQFGLARPPTVTLKRGMDQSLVLWGWHLLALQGDPRARAPWLGLDMYSGGGLAARPDHRPLMSYTLLNAWCAQINISSARAGEGIVTEDITIACDLITQGDGDRGH